MSLADCISKAGKALSGQDRAAIEKMVADGMGETDAVDAHLSTLNDEVQAVADQVTEAGGDVVSTFPEVDEFYNSILAAKEASQFGAAVHVYDRSDYENTDLFLYDGGKAGFAISKTGAIISVFKHPDSSIDNAMPVLIQEAIRQGATHLDAFDGFLTEQYAKLGFVEVWRQPWDDQYTPEGWNKETMGTPDVVYMGITDEGVTTATDSQPVLNPERVRSGIRGVGSYKSGASAPLEGSPNVRGASGPDIALVNVAEQYAAANGIELARQSRYARVDPARASRIAEAYDQMEHSPQDPQVREAYDNLIRQTTAQYEALVDAGYQFYFFDETNDPYDGNPWNAMRELRATQTMGVFATDGNFGSGATEIDVADNPLLADTGITWPYGSTSGEQRPVLANDLFRAVHDAFGHGLEGAGFRAEGEENAWQAHARLFTGSALNALTSETRGQNSWLNYGPYGETNRTAPVEETVFADQKTGLLPDWVVTEGRLDQPQVLNQQAQRSDLGLYSGVEKAVLEMKLPQWTPSKKNPDGSALGKDVWAKIKSSPIKKEEVEWLGIEEFLTADPQARFTRNEVAEYVRSNGINIEEVVADQEVGEGTEIEWNTPEVWDDPEAYQYRVEEMMYDFGNGDQDAIDEFEPRGWLLDNIDDVVANYQTSIPDLDEVVEREDYADGILDYIESQGYDVFDDMSSQMLDAAKEAAEKAAKREYMDNPIYIQQPYEESINLIIFGNDDQGYDVRTSMMFSDVVRSDIWSQSEAQIQAEDYAREYGMLDEEESPTVHKWSEYIMDGYADNYREIKLTLPDIEGDFYNETHFPDRNLLAFLRVTDRDLETGVEKQTEDEFQSKHRIDFRFVDHPKANAENEFERPIHKRIVEVFDIDTGDVITTLSPDGRLTEFDFIEQAREKLANAEPGKKINNLETLGDGIVGIRKPKQQGGNKTYFIDEFQSDWHQDGRQKGYATGEVDPVQVQENVDRYDEDIFEPLMVDVKRLYLDLIDQEALLVDGQDANNDQFILNEYGIDGATINKLQALQIPSVSSSADGISKFVEAHGNPDLVDRFRNHLIESERLLVDYRQARAEREGVTDAPFKGDAWIGLGLKRAIVDAAESGFESIAWPNSRVLMNRWSERYEQLYRIQYDKKMSSIVKKLTKQQPKQFTTEGVPYNQSEEAYVFSDSFDTREQLERDGISDDSQLVTDDGKLRDGLQVVETADGKWNLYDTSKTPEGYWIIPITDELKAQVEEKGLPLFQRGGDPESPRGTIKLLPDNQRIIQLGRASDPSTFLHEAGHLFLEMEKQFAAEFGLSEDQQTILDWMGVESFEEIGVEQHEKWAETFEVYLEEGKAPSLKLRDVFASFRRWLTSVYRSLDPRTRADLTPEIREVFDRLLATEEEIEAASSNPAFDQFFRSKEQAGMTDQEWEAYQKRKQRAKDKAQTTIDQKIIEELRRRKTAEWKAEKAPILEEEKERLSRLPVFQILSDAGTPDGMMDYDMVKELNGGKVPGNMTGKAKKGGRDPAEYAELYEHVWPSADEMIKAIATTPALSKMADEAAENRMLDKYGDILNDGTIEREAQEAIHNEDQARLLLIELKALGRKVGARESINREYLKAQAKTMIGSMTYAEIKPSKFYRAELRATQKAVTATSEQEAYEAKIQQIANHYLYRESVLTHEAMERQRKYVNRAQTKTYSKGQMDQSYALNRMMLAKSYNMRQGEPQRNLNVQNIVAWMATQITTPNGYADLDILDPHIMKMVADFINGKPVDYTLPTFKDLTAKELRGLYDQLRHMRFIGGRLSDEARAKLGASRQTFADSIKENTNKEIEITLEEKGTMARSFDAFKELVFSHRRLGGIMETLDGFESGGPGEAQYRKMTDATNKELELTDRIAEELDDSFKPVLKSINKRHKTTITRQDGGKFTLSHRQRFVLALNWGNQSNKDTVLQGLNENLRGEYTEADVIKMLSGMTNTELEAVNKVWAVNESLWPEMSSVEMRVKGVSTTKIQPLPFVINGVRMTGGHYQLHYRRHAKDSARRDLAIEQGARDSIKLGTAGSLNDRVGSGGRLVDLDLRHLFNDLSERVHYIAYAEVAGDFNAMFKGENNPVVEEIQAGYGDEYYDNVIESLDVVINPDTSTHVLWRFLRWVRSNMTYAYLVGSIRNVLQQPIAITNAIAQMKGKYVLQGAMEFYRSPVENWHKISEASAFMRNRTKLVNREAREQMLKLDSLHPKMAAMKNMGFLPQTFVDALIAFPTWMGAKTKYKAENPGATEQDAIYYADEMVKKTIGSGLAQDVGAILNKGEAEKQITFMGTFFNLTWNLHVENAQLLKRGKINGMEYARRVGWMAIAPALIAMWILDDVPEDEDEVIPHTLKEIGLYNASSLFLARDIASSMDGFSTSIPGLKFADGIARVTNDMKDLVTGDEEMDAELVASILRGLAPVAKIPASGQVARSLEGAADPNQDPYGVIVEGKERNR